MSSGTLLAVCRVHELLPTSDSTGVTAIDKRPAAGPVKVYGLGLSGDLQASRKHHGGESKAVYAYSQDDADYWAAELGTEIMPGLFGENLRIAGIPVSEAVIGERWQIGATTLLEVTCPRTPCRNFAVRMQQPRWVARFAEAGRVGTYLRVVRNGTISAGDTVSVIHRPNHGVTSGDVFRGVSGEQARLLARAEANGELRLSPELQKILRKLHRRQAAANA
ncbi:MOSC domain-containing protein [Arthrobacter sp. zg-Y820]|uniref:MOSC domain-containing protein n=1 Tax=unclassified Arthrobacter TaxID=235627 RepID=UPI001E45FDE5|nr:MULTISPECIES: MOSC domain-containing protein [unclassified Arthrobacter]MCC9195738.1 MOSC domain-containing protein [Arthrobacter sp. zg-Y820]MDK1278597.1 MOSC domain-containing protein [Arthrobacter sp. zg.Y820]WIB08970.1 MOSC domain-containing protein [Arthrobacter sp. zg-Y820]